MEDALRQSLSAPWSVAIDSPNGTAFDSAILAAGGSFAVTTSRGGAMLWDARTGHRVRALDIDANDGVWTAASAVLSDNGGWLFVGGSDGIVRGWNAATGERVATFRYPSGPRKSVTADGKWGFSRDVSNAVRVWGRSGGPPFELPLHPGYGSDTASTLDGALTLKASPLEIHDLRTGGIGKLAGHSVPPFSASLSVDGNAALRQARMAPRKCGTWRPAR